MPIKYSDSSDEPLPSFPHRVLHKVSGSLGSKKIKKQIRFETKEELTTSGRRRPRDVAKPPYEGQPIRRLLRLSSAFNVDGSHDSRRQISEESLQTGTNQHRRRHHSHTLETVQEIPSSRTSRRPTFINGVRSETDLIKQARTEAVAERRLHGRHSSACSDMHRSVKSGDYLLARGANPRTGVVTPSHSASSSLDHDVAPQVERRPARWRQKGDQWVSLDQGEPTPVPESPPEKFPEFQSQLPRTPAKLADERQRNSVRATSTSQDLESSNIPPNAGQINSRPKNHDVLANPSVNEPSVSTAKPKLKFEAAVKRKPVGSPPNKSPREPGSHVQLGSSDSTDTVLRKPRFNGDLRTSSAPTPPLGRLVNAQSVDKDLPSIPRGSFLHGNGSAPVHGHFLEPRGTDQPVNVPHSSGSIISGPTAVEKELPCLPMNSGPSQSTPVILPYPTSPEKATGKREPDRRHWESERIQGPREGVDPAYPYIRTARPTYPVPLTMKANPLLGERPMPIPVYDNPPRRLSPLMRTTAARMKGPRGMPPRPTRSSEKPMPIFDPLLNTTITHTDMFMSRPGHPRAPPTGPVPMRPRVRPMNRGHHGLSQNLPRHTDSAIIMNTSMNVDTDSLMSIPMPRMRPRAIPRPTMPMRAGGMYGVPRIDPGRERFRETEKVYQRPKIPPVVEQMPLPTAHATDSHQVPEQIDLPTQFAQIPTPTDDEQTEEAGTKQKCSGLMRKCSRCTHGFVDVKAQNIDSVIHTSVLPKDNVEAKGDIRRLHPARSPLPALPEEKNAPEGNNSPQKISALSHQRDETDERNHSICCPQCCKLDCHEGCLGHPSPTSSPVPVNGAVSSSQEVSGVAEVSKPADHASPLPMNQNVEAEEKTKTTVLGTMRSALKISPKKDQESRSGVHVQAALSKAPVELSIQPPSPASSPAPDNFNSQDDAAATALNGLQPLGSNTASGAAAAALSAINSAQRKTSTPRPVMHKRQRSNSLPSIGLSLGTRKISGTVESQRTVSGSRLRIPSPLGLSVSCFRAASVDKSGHSRSRNASGTSMSTIELQVPSLASLTTSAGYTALSEIVFVPLEATKMWIRTHPQILSLGRDMSLRAWEMAQVLTKTAWQLWAVVFVYSKTGKVKFNAKRGETVSGFLMDMARSLLYLLVFAAVGALMLWILSLVISVLRVGVWVVRTIVWIVRSILGVKAIK